MTMTDAAGAEAPYNKKTVPGFAAIARRADGGDEIAMWRLTELAKERGFDPDAYETWSALAVALREFSAPKPKEDKPAPSPRPKPVPAPTEWNRPAALAADPYWEKARPDEPTYNLDPFAIPKTNGLAVAALVFGIIGGFIFSITFGMV